MHGLFYSSTIYWDCVNTGLVCEAAIEAGGLVDCWLQAVDTVEAVPALPGRDS